MRNLIRKNVEKGVYGGAYGFIAITVTFICVNALGLDEKTSSMIGAGLAALTGAIINRIKKHNAN